MTCPSCHADVLPGARFCAECGQDLRLRGDERRVVTVVFADLVGFTSLSETRDPEQVKNLVDGCFEHLVADIDAFGGRVDKIIGDAIVALFGAPVAHEDDAERAVRAALRMQATLARVTQDLDVEVRMRIGVNTGEVLVGALRSGGDYTAMGDVVNTANRLQTAAAPGTVLVGPATHAATSRVVRYDALEPISAKGREELVPAWQALDAVLPPGYRPERNRAALIGREPELGLLKHSIDNAVRNERAGLLLVLGEAGVGKSRLAEELAALTACEHDALVLEGRCVPYGEANVWWPVADALRYGCGIRSSDPVDHALALAEEAVRTALGDDAAEAEVHRVLQGLLFLMGYESELRKREATRAREEATAAVVTFAEKYSEQRPVVVVLSDLHWADDVVLELIDTLLERLCTRRFVVLSTARRVIEERWHPPHGRHNLVVLTLDPLSADAASELLRDLAGVELDDTLAAALLDRSGGNPFFLEELVTLLEETGVVGGHAQATELPDTLRGLVAARLDGLEPNERRVLDDCAVLGRRGSFTSIEVMARKHLGITEVRPVLASLEAKELLVISGVGAAEKWTFRSDVVREVAYSTLTKSDRAKSHAGIAAYMEEHDQERSDATDRIAFHYVRAAELYHDLGAPDDVALSVRDRALDWVGRAAERAEQAELSTVAERLYGEGLRLLAGQHGSLHRRFLAGRARALTQVRELAAARADALAAVEESRAAGPEGEVDLAPALVALAGVEQKESAWAAAEEALTEASVTYARLGDPQGEAEVQRVRGFGALLRFDYDAAVVLLEDAQERFEQLGDRRGVAWAQQNLAWCAFYMGRAEEAEHKLRAAAATFEELGDTAGRGWALGLLAWTRFQQGHNREAGAMAEGVIEEIRNRDDRWALGMMLVLIGSVRIWTGRPASAIPFLEEARENLAAIEDVFGLLQADANLGRALVCVGRIDEAFGLLPAGRGVLPPGLDREHVFAVMATTSAAVQIGDTELAATLLRLAPEVRDGGEEILVGDTERAVATGLHRLQVGDIVGAVQVLESLDRHLVELDANARSALALARVADGDLDGALAAAGDVLTADRTSHLDRVIAGIAKSLALHRRGDGTAAQAAFDQVTALADGTEDRVAQALARLADATAASARGEADAAARCEEADRRLADLGLTETGWRRAFSLALGMSSVA